MPSRVPTLVKAGVFIGLPPTLNELMSLLPRRLAFILHRRYTKLGLQWQRPRFNVH